MPDPQQQQPLTEQEDRPHKYKAGPDWVLMTESKMSSDTKGVQPSVTMSELNPLDKELGKDKVNNMLGDYYLEETVSAVKKLICANPGLTGSESTEAMDVDVDPQLEPAA